MTTFGDRLRIQREKLGLNQTNMAKLIGKHKNTQVAYESNDQSPTVATLEVLAGHGVDIHFLIFGTYADAAGSRQLAQLLSVLHDLPPSHQALGFGMLSMLRATISGQGASAEVATALWNGVQLFNDFVALTPEEQAAVRGTMDALKASHRPSDGECAV